LLVAHPTTQPVLSTFFEGNQLQDGR
jgi:hypothetical protein